MGFVYFSSSHEDTVSRWPAADQEEGGKCSRGIYSPRSLIIDCVLTEGHSTPPSSQVLYSFVPTGPLAGLFTMPAVFSPEDCMSLCVK